MDTKITLSFDEEVIKSAKNYAKRNGISLSRLTEFIYRQLTDETYTRLEELPVNDWVNMVAEGQAQYNAKPPRRSKKDFYEKS